MGTGPQPSRRKGAEGPGAATGPIRATLPLVLCAMGKDQLMLDSQNASCAHSGMGQRWEAPWTLHLRMEPWVGARWEPEAWVQLTLRGAAEPRASPSFHRPQRGEPRRGVSLPPPPTCEGRVSPRRPWLHPPARPQPADRHRGHAPRGTQRLGTEGLKRPWLRAPRAGLSGEGCRRGGQGEYSPHSASPGR